MSMLNSCQAAGRARMLLAASAKRIAEIGNSKIQVRMPREKASVLEWVDRARVVI